MERMKYFPWPLIQLNIFQDLFLIRERFDTGLRHFLPAACLRSLIFALECLHLPAQPVLVKEQYESELAPWHRSTQREVCRLTFHTMSLRVNTDRFCNPPADSY